MNSIQNVDDGNYNDFMGHDRVALLLTLSSCGSCASYTREIEQLLQKGQLEGLQIGKVVLDRAGSAKLKRANPWIKRLDFLPYTVLYSNGDKVDEFAASRGDFLRLRTDLAWAE